MKTILIKEGCPNPVSLGEKGENGVGAVLFDYSEWLNDFGNGAISLLVKRKGDTAAYPVVLTTADGIATWTISDTDTAVQGYGKAEYIFTIDSKVAKSAVFSFYVAADLGPAGDPPDPYESWIDTLTELGGETLINAQAAQAAQEAAETAQSNAETAATNAATSATNAAQSAGAARFAAESALASADSASASATAASGHATAAETAKDLAISAAEDAQHSETQAELSASAAAESAESASGSATTATTAAQNAATSASNASGSATAAATSETNAASSATSAAASATEAATEAAKLNNYLPTDTASGAIASFSDGADDVPVEALSVALEPVQDLNGQSSPYPGGGGKNLLDYSTASLTTTITKFADGIKLTANQAYTFSYYGTENVSIICYLHGEDTRLFTSGYTKSYTYTPTEDVIVDVSFYNSPSIVSAENLFQLENGTVKTDWTPYSNICPITGHTQCEVWREATYDTTAQPQFTIPLGQTVYGGSIDVVGGVLTVDRAMVVFDGSQPVGLADWRPFSDSSAWLYSPAVTPGFTNQQGKDGLISDRLESIRYSDGIYYDNIGISAVGSATWGVAMRVPVAGLNTSALINAWLADNPVSVVYDLATPIEIQLSDIPQLSTLYGQNNVWSDSGDVDITYRADIGLYIQKMISEALA